jgi:hypothetical protein
VWSRRAVDDRLDDVDALPDHRASEVGKLFVGISRWVMTVAPSLWRLTVAE